MGRVERDQAELPPLDPAGDHLPALGLDLSLADVPPPDQDIAIVERVVADPELRVVLAGRPHRQAGLRGEVIGDRVADEIFIGLFLGRLLFVPDQHADRRRLGRPSDRSVPASAATQQYSEKA